jgi:hypothetical protein
VVGSRRPAGQPSLNGAVRLGASALLFAVAMRGDSNPLIIHRHLAAARSPAKSWVSLFWSFHHHTLAA